jgi:triosephosphate isomerase
MRIPFIAGNWKMNGSKEMARAFFADIKANYPQSAAVEIGIFPPCIYMAEIQSALANTSIVWGAQNICSEQEGAFTGEISANMLLDFACQYVIIGHSERRQLMAETDELIAAKYKAAILAGLKPILCIGETLEQREANQTFDVVMKQLDKVLALEQQQSGILANLTVAYEPIWAIGTGKTASPQQAQEVHEVIRGHIAKYRADLAETIRLLYGGSVKADNAAALLAMPDIDGGLIGGASLASDSFLSICNIAAELNR